MRLFRRRPRPVGPVLPGDEPPPGLARSLRARIGVWLRPPRRLRPTLAGWLFMLMVVAVIGAALNTGNNLLYMLCSLMLAMIAASGVLSESSLRRVVVRRQLPRTAFVGRPAAGRLRVRNPRRWLPIAALAFQDRPGRACDGVAEEVVVPWIPPGEETSWPVEYRFRRRGLHRFGGHRVSTTYPFGLFRKWYDLPGPDDVLVYPELDTGGALADDPGPRRGERDGLGPGLDGDYQGLRDFVDGEDARRIHWKTSARRGALVAVERGRSAGAACTVYLLPGGNPADGEAYATAFEAAVSRAAGAVVRWLDAGDEVGLVSPAARFAPGRGEAQKRALLGHLAVVEAQDAPLNEELNALRIRLGGRDVTVA